LSAVGEVFRLGSDGELRFVARLPAGHYHRTNMAIGPDGSVFVVIEGDRAVAAVTRAEPTVGLVFYDLKTCLRSVEAPPKRKRRAPAKKTQPEADDAAT